MKSRRSSMNEQPKTKTFRPWGTYLGAIVVPMRMEKINRLTYVELLAQRIQRLVDQEEPDWVAELLSRYPIEEIWDLFPRMESLGQQIAEAVQYQLNLGRLFGNRKMIRIKVSPKWQGTLDEDNLEEYLGDLHYQRTG